MTKIAFVINQILKIFKLFLFTFMYILLKVNFLPTCIESCISVSWHQIYFYIMPPSKIKKLNYYLNLVAISFFKNKKKYISIFPSKMQMIFIKYGEKNKKELTHKVNNFSPKECL